MRSPEELRERLRARWLNQRRNWLLDKGEWPWSLGIGRPTANQLLANWQLFDSWLRQWRKLADLSNAHVEQETLNLGPAGEQHLPSRWVFASPAIVAAELGQSTRWTRAKQRFDTLSVSYGALERWRVELSRHFDLLADLEDGEFERLCRVVDWLRRHPASGLYPRQLPISGVDSKWLETRTRVVSSWVRALSASEVAGDFHAVTGLRKPPDRLRMRLLDPALRALLGGLSDIEAPLADIANLRLPIKHVLIVENLYTGLSMDDLPGTVLFMGRGNAVESFAQIPWLIDIPITYWGDLDTTGLVILNRLRSYLPQVRSLMMDEEALHAFKHLWGVDVTHAAELLPFLSEAELRIYRALRDDTYGVKVRLEQERIGWDWAWSRLIGANPAS